jgi:uncharacterized protein (TIGR02757 family)
MPEGMKFFLDQLVQEFQVPGFINQDPISIPHRFSIKQDIEIAGFWTAMLSWGLRKTIIRKASELMDLMDNAPYLFILHHTEKDRIRFEDFVHRTFQSTDSLYFLEFFQTFYREYDSLEEAFILNKSNNPSWTLKQGIADFHDFFFQSPLAPKRTRKHIATPVRKSTCKRINMFLRWMVRSNTFQVDFGIWKSIDPAQLYIPLDVHVEHISRKLHLLQRKQRDWEAVEELTQKLRNLDPEDPAKYDFALFGLGVVRRDWKMPS